MTIDRRMLIKAGAALPVAAMIGMAASRADAAVCYDPAKLTLGQRSQRRSLGYADQSAEASKYCGRCAFFTAAPGGCGGCQLMNGAPVLATGLCNSFAAKGK